MPPSRANLVLDVDLVLDFVLVLDLDLDLVLDLDREPAGVIPAIYAAHNLLKLARAA